jgi:hypothetical protein
MSRRKGEVTGQNEREFPHLVELNLPPGGSRCQNLVSTAFLFAVAAAGMRWSNSTSASASPMPPLLMLFESASVARA